MSNEKILKVMAEVNGEVCERAELIHGIALALLTRKNLFVGRKSSKCNSITQKILQREYANQDIF